MSNQDADFRERAKRLRMQPRQYAQAPSQGSVADSDFDEHAIFEAILLPQLAFIVGAVAMVAGRSISMNVLTIVPSTDLLGLGEGCVVGLLLVVAGLLFGKSNLISHAALVLGAAAAFFGESFYIPVIPDLMESIYNAEYVGRVLLNAH